MNAFAPTAQQRLARARSDLRMGLPVALESGKTTMLVAAAEVLDAKTAKEMARDNQAQLVLTARRAATLKIAAYDGDLARLPVGADMTPAKITAIIDPATDLDRPMKGPFAPLRGGDVGPHRAAIALVKSARLLPAALIAPYDGPAEGLTRLRIAEVDPEATIAPSHVVSARLPMATAPEGRLHLFHPDDGGASHSALEIGRPDRASPVLARLHSACFTGDVLGSLKCDCGPQLNGALAQMHAEGGGVLLYLDQEGRGIGLANKLRAYALQDQGFDTVEANHRLGFEDDERDFRVGAAILREMRIGTVRLLTNNPRKVEMLEQNGITVAERVPLWVGETAQNAGYLAVKAAKSGHLK